MSLSSDEKVDFTNKLMNHLERLEYNNFDRNLPSHLDLDSSILNLVISQGKYDIVVKKRDKAYNAHQKALKDAEANLISESVVSEYYLKFLQEADEVRKYFDELEAATKHYETCMYNYIQEKKVLKLSQIKNSFKVI